MEQQLVQNIGIPAFFPHRDVVVTEAPADSKLLVSNGGLWDCKGKGDEISPLSAV